MIRQEMPWCLRWFPASVPPTLKREFLSIGKTIDRWNGEFDVGIAEREWPGLASLTLIAGRSSVAFYGESIAWLKSGLREALEKAGGREGTKARGTLLYNGAHAATGRLGVFSTAHPQNERYRTCLEAVLHAEGVTSASVMIRRPWGSGETAFPPGIFEAIHSYLSRHATTRRR